MANKREEDVKKGIGTVAARILTKAHPHFDGLEAVVAPLIEGNISPIQQAAVARFLREHHPATTIGKALDTHLVRDAAVTGKEFVAAGNYAGLMAFLCDGLQAENVKPANPYAADPSVVAKRLAGSPLMCLFSPGSVEAGLITSVGTYTGKDDKEGKNFPRLWLPGQEPGTIGVWHSPARGGYDVAAIAAHEQGQEGYVAIFSATTGSDKLGMDAIAQRLGFSQLEGTSILAPDCQLKIALRGDEESDGITDNMRVKQLPASRRKGADVGYEVVLKK